MGEAVIRGVLVDLLKGIDGDALDYFTGMVVDNETVDEAELTEMLAPFIESYGLAESSDAAVSVCHELCQRLRGVGLKDSSSSASSATTTELLDKPVVLSEVTKSQINKSDQDTIDTLWGFDTIRQKRNDTMEMTEAGSARYERKALKDQKKWLAELESKFVGEEDDSCQISNMMLPDLSGTSRELDIHVSNFTITYGGAVLLDGADLRLVRGRRYGLVGRNGVGKTTLLKHMAAFDIEGFPRHHRVLHVKQEVKSSSQSVIQVVLEADVERKQLLTREAEILAIQELEAQGAGSGDGGVGAAAQAQALAQELQNIYQRMDAIGCSTAEARAASILSGLRFTDAMQHCPTDSLSGGWRMRVALAGALFIEPDLLMLDEPTNHLDLEAVLWLEDYLQTYPHTVLLVSHDRAFLNEVCTDVILFKDLKLAYYRGNYDTFENTRSEMLLVQQRQHEAQMVKVAHMQEFVDKFRYNAKRASLVQSRIKAIAREDVVDAVEEDTDGFRFSFIDAGQLGRPVIQIEGVTFGFNRESTTVLGLHEAEAEESAGVAKSAADVLLEQKFNILFRNVHLNIDQESRVALVGPNGAGKSTLLNLIQGKLAPQAGYVHCNPQLRLAVFTQYHLDSFDLHQSPLQNLAVRWPKVHESELRAHLGRYEITGNDALKPMKFSSGGQKSRVAFAALTYSKPHVVILDEPTNHLDMEAIQALSEALQAFTGGVVVISHDQHFIQSVCKEIWVVKNKTVAQFRGTFVEYKRVALSQMTGIKAGKASGHR